jgi:tRNA(fMet)-specific endonuclease VapC
MIAATAISHDFPLYTCNLADFEHIVELDLRPFPHPDAAGN